jgi:hypothetical protein
MRARSRSRPFGDVDPGHEVEVIVAHGVHDPPGELVGREPAGYGVGVHVGDDAAHVDDHVVVGHHAGLGGLGQAHRGPRGLSLRSPMSGIIPTGRPP